MQVPLKPRRRVESCNAGSGLFGAWLAGLLALSGARGFAAPNPSPSPPEVIYSGDVPHPGSGTSAGGGACGRRRPNRRDRLDGRAGETRRQDDPKGRRPGVALPGFADAHVHVESLGAQLESLDLRGLGKSAILARIAAAAGPAPPGSWVVGSGWDQGFWHPADFPTAQELDAASAGHPVRLTRIDEHSYWVNSRVLALANVTGATRDPDGGLIRRDPAGEPTGILVDNAMAAVDAVEPQPGRADRMRRVHRALEQYSRWGLTSVHDAGTDLEIIGIYRELLARHQLPVRVYAMALGEGPRAHYLATGPAPDVGDGMLAVRSLKLILDGALGSRGAEMTEPYADAPKERGLSRLSDAALDDIVAAARRQGLQVNVHAIGDRAVTRVLDAFERGGVTRNDRFRVEHASIVTDQNLARFARLGIIASMQPVFVGEYSRWAEERVGRSRIRWVLRTRDFASAGVMLAAGTDYPASDAGSPLATLHCLVTRQGADGSPAAGWYREQRLDVDRSLRMMTAGPAFAAFQERDLGSLTVGRYADFTALSANPYDRRPDDLRSLAVRMTVVAGRITFENSGHPGGA